MGTLELQSQVRCRGQSVALKLLHKHKHSIDSCHLKAAQSDWLHAWLLVMLCSRTLTCTCSHRAAEGQMRIGRRNTLKHVYTHTHTLSLWVELREHELPYHISLLGSNWEPVEIKRAFSNRCYIMGQCSDQTPLSDWTFVRKRCDALQNHFKSKQSRSTRAFCVSH